MTKVKICGLRTTEDVMAVNRFLPDYIGFVFAPGKRQIDMETAKCLREELASGIQAVGVFVNQEISLVSAFCKNRIIDMVQLHGDEDLEYVSALRKEVPSKIIKAVPVGTKRPQLLVNHVDHLLFDTMCGAQRGGSGKIFDWKLLSGCETDFFLAGGLNPENVQTAISCLNPYCVDVSSGVETDGGKDPVKIQRLVQAVREANMRHG